VVDILDSLLLINKNAIAVYEPVFYQYGLLKQQLFKYRDIENQGGWTMQSPAIKKLKKGDNEKDVQALKQQLLLMGDLEKNNGTTLFDDTLETAVRNFQKRHGIQPDGIISDKTIE